MITNKLWLMIYINQSGQKKSSYEEVHLDLPSILSKVLVDGAWYGTSSYH